MARKVMLGYDGHEHQTQDSCPETLLSKDERASHPGRAREGEVWLPSSCRGAQAAASPTRLSGEFWVEGHTGR